MNSSAIASAIAGAMDTYPRLLSSKEYQSFYAYIRSLKENLPHTADIVIASSRLHFILIANSLKEEFEANLMILGLLYLHPLASFDLYVQDVRWYIRQHYQYFSMLKVDSSHYHQNY
jgi:hypothetical protein